MLENAFWVLAALLVLTALYLLNRLLDSLGHPLRCYRRYARVTAQEARHGALCRLVGKARRHPDYPLLPAWFSDRAALIRKTKLMRSEIGSDSDDPYEARALEDLPVTAFLLDDDSGTVTVELVRRGGERRCELSCTRLEEVRMDKVEPFLASRRMSLKGVEEGFPWGQAILPGDYHVREELLLEGDTVVVAGRCREEPSAGGSAEGGYRTAPTRKVVFGELGRPLFVSNLPGTVEWLE